MLAKPPKEQKSQTAVLLGLFLGRLRVIPLSASLDRVVNFTTMYRHLARCLDAQTYLVTTNLNHDDRDFIVDDDALVLFSRQN